MKKNVLIPLFTNEFRSNTATAAPRKSMLSTWLLLGAMLVSGGAWGQTWTGATSGAWLTAGNWSPSGAPSGTSAEAIIDDNAQPTIGIDMNGIAVSNSSIGAIHFGPSATTARTINNSSGVTAGNMTLNGITVNSVANTILRNNSATTHIITNGPQALGIVLGNATNNLINIDAAGGITIASVISGGSNALTKSGAGAGVLELTAQNTYTGATTVSGGTLRLNRTGGTTLPTPTCSAFRMEPSVKRGCGFGGRPIPDICFTLVTSLPLNNWTPWFQL